LSVIFTVDLSGASTLSKLEKSFENAEVAFVEARWME
jgi:hypothetical protein